MLRIPHSPVDTLHQRLVEIRIMLRIVLRIAHSAVDTLRQRLVEIIIVLRIVQGAVSSWVGLERGVLQVGQRPLPSGSSFWGGSPGPAVEGEGPGTLDP